MLKLSVLFLFFRTIPEGILLIFANYVAINKTVDKSLFISGIFLGIGTYLVRFLPIHFGVHTIIVFCIYVFSSVILSNINFHKSIQLSSIWIILLSVLDYSLVYVYIKLLGINLNSLLNDNLISILLGLPSLIIFTILILIIHMKNLQKVYRKGKS